MLLGFESNLRKGIHSHQGRGNGKWPAIAEISNIESGDLAPLGALS